MATRQQITQDRQVRASTAEATVYEHAIKDSKGLRIRVVGADAKLSHFRMARQPFSEPLQSAPEPHRPCSCRHIVWLTAASAGWLILESAPTNDAFSTALVTDFDAAGQLKFEVRQ